MSATSQPGNQKTSFEFVEKKGMEKTKSTNPINAIHTVPRLQSVHLVSIYVLYSNQHGLHELCVSHL